MTMGSSCRDTWFIMGAAWDDYGLNFQTLFNIFITEPPVQKLEDEGRTSTCISTESYHVRAARSRLLRPIDHMCVFVI